MGKSRAVEAQESQNGRSNPALRAGRGNCGGGTLHRSAGDDERNMVTCQRVCETLGIGAVMVAGDYYQRIIPAARLTQTVKEDT